MDNDGEHCALLIWSNDYIGMHDVACSESDSAYCGCEAAPQHSPDSAPRGPVPHEAEPFNGIFRLPRQDVWPAEPLGSGGATAC